MPRRERVLSERALNRALLARQLLLERARIPVASAIERVGCLQTQYAPSAYIGLWSRLEGFERDHLTSALERRTVIQGTLMRMTIHMVSRRDYWPLAEAIRKPRRSWWLSAVRHRASQRQVVAAALRTRRLLADGPRDRDELVKELGVDSTTWNGVGLWIDLVRVPPSGTWDRRSANVYGLAEDWVGRPEPRTRLDEPLRLLVRRYLGGFGPATLKDCAGWAGLPAKLLEPVVAAMSFRRFETEAGDELLDLPRAPRPDPDTPAPVRFLPTWDATLLAHARRTQILPEPHRARVFGTKTPQSVPTFLVDGRVAGSWHLERGRIRLTPFERLSRTTRHDLDEEAERLEALHA